MQNVVPVLLFTVLIYLGTVFEFPIPGTTIMQTGQTIAVLCAGALLGPRSGALSVLLYVLLGAAGLPIFSEGASGLRVLEGASGGYLLGFIVAAATMGAWRDGGLFRNELAAFIGMLIGHAIILVSGWLWMTVLMGSSAAYENGVAPFYLGSIVKSLLSAVLILLLARMGSREQKAFV